MTTEQLQSLFQQPFKMADYIAFVQAVFQPTQWRVTPEQLPLAQEEGAGYYLGKKKTNDNYELDFYYFRLNASVAQRRVGLRNLMRTYLRLTDAALVVFDDGTHWRLSFICDLRDEATAPKRFTFVFGDPHCGYHTPVSRFMALQKDAVTFETLRNAFSVEALTKEFYQKLFNWYLWAVSPEAGVTFPNNTKIEEDDREKIDIKIIRLITRLMFVWFIKQKDLVPDNLFNPEYLSTILRDFNPQATDNGNYYNAILQNLFFATLNRAIRDEEGAGRGFATSDRADIKTLYRYAEMFSISESEVIDLFSKIPFLNGGLFECLDKNKMQDGVEIAYYNDGFSRNADRFNRDGHYKYRAFIPNNLFFADEHKETITSGGDSQVLQVEGLLHIFAQYNFTVEENTPSEQQVALDPELLGKVFENLLGAYNPETQETARKETGSFYTPREIVNYMVDESLLAYLGNSDIVRLLFSEDFEKDSMYEAEYQDIADKLKNIRILDPACGSGAFPMGLLNRMVDILEKINPNEDTYTLKLEIIENCLYGSDIQPIAAQIAKLRFFISLICNCKKKPGEPNFGIPTLPNLETKFVTANSLKAPKSMQLCDQRIITLRDQLQTVRHQHFNAKTVSQKVHWRKEDEVLREQLSQLLNKDDAFVSEDVRQMASWNPYDQNAVSPFFDPEWMFGITEGFDVVIGNPPYIQLQKDGGELGSQYENCGFKTFAKTGDMYCLFYERGQQLLKQGRHLCYITSNKWMRSDYGKKLRQFFVDNTDPLVLIDFAGVKIFESATVDTNILLFANAQNQPKTRYRQKTICAVANKQNKDSVRNNLSGFVRQQHTMCSFTTSDSWVVFSPIKQQIKTKVESVGTPLKEWNIRINYGIKTGCNDAFIIDTQKRNEILANTSDYVPYQAENKYAPQGEYARTAALIRPILRGRDIKRYGYEWAGLWLIATVPSRHYDIDKYPAVKQYLLSFGKERLEQTGETHEINGQKIKSRKKTSNDWFETQDPIAYLNDFSLPKIVYGQFQDDAEYSFAEGGVYLSSNEYMIICPNYSPKCLLAYLNSNAMKWQLENTTGSLGENTKIGQKSNFVKLSVPILSSTKQKLFDDLVDKILSLKNANPTADTTPYERQIDALVYELYGITSYEELLEIEGDKDKALEMLILITHYRHPDATDILPLLPEDIASSDTILPIIANMRKQGMIQ